MKNYIFSLLLAIAFSSINPLFAMDKQEETTSNCFLVKSSHKGDKGQFVVQEGPEDEPHPPCCTFNAALAVIGFATGNLKNAQEPVWPYEEHYNATREVLKHLHNPTLWMKNSSVWYTQCLVPKIGIKEVQKWLPIFGYGNEDLSGYKKEANGLSSTFWISSSLKISPREQLDFIEKLCSSTLPAPEKAQELAQAILYLEDLSPDWKFYGKTGAGSLNDDMKYGWFVGWVTDGNTTFTAVRYLEAPGPDYPSPKAKEQVKEKFKELIKKQNELIRNEKL